MLISDVLRLAVLPYRPIREKRVMNVRGHVISFFLQLICYFQ